MSDCLFAVKHVQICRELLFILWYLFLWEQTAQTDRTDQGINPPRSLAPGGPPLTRPRNTERKTERKSEKGQKQREASLSHYDSKLHNSLFFLSSELVFLWASDIWIIVWYPSVWARGDRKKTTHIESFIQVITKREKKHTHTHNMVNVFVFSFILLSSLFFIHASFSSQST